MKDISIVGVGMTDFGEHDRTLPELFADAAESAMDDSGISPDDLDGLYVGNTFAGEIDGQSHLGPVIASYLGIPGIPVTRVEDACASSSNAFRQAVMAVESGRYETVLVGGVERTSAATGYDTAERTEAFSRAADAKFEQPVGMTFPGAFALVTQRAMHDGRFTEREMAEVAVKNHANGAKNVHSHFRTPIDVADVLKSAPVATPLKLYDCAPFTDGAAALVITSRDNSSLITGTSVRIASTAQVTGRTPLHDKPDLGWLDVVEKAGAKAFEKADVGPKDIDIAEVHDCFTSAELLITEALGFFEPGEAGNAVASGRTSLDGKLPINPSGGLKAKGHPVGATGCAQLVEIAEQLRGNCSDRQVPNARLGLAQNLGGDFASAIVTLLEVEA